MTHGLLLKYILSHGIGIDVFLTFFLWFSESGLHNRNEQLHWVLNFKAHQTCTGTKKHKF